MNGEINMGSHFDKPYGSDMGKHNKSHIGCLHGPNAVPAKVICKWVTNGKTYGAHFDKPYGSDMGKHN